MAKNDLILLDSVLKQATRNYSEQYDQGEIFELFSIEQILKEYDPSFEEMIFGWVDGKDDGGIDAAYVFLDQKLLFDKPNPNEIRLEPIIDVILAICKHKDSFRQEPIASVSSIISELLDLSIESENLTAIYNEDLLKFRDIFKETYLESIVKKPKLNIRYFYSSRGDASDIAENIQSRSDLLIENTEELFSNVQVEFTFLGASQLLSKYRTIKNFSLRLKYIENTVSRDKTNYIALVKLTDFYNFISDENGKLRRYLFEANVRDYLGLGAVNSDIYETLSAKNSDSAIDFWWLNNGVTIVATSVLSAGKELTIDNIQIVNGLQTTETIYRYFTEISNPSDDRAVLVKVIVAGNEIARDQIIRATNNQSPVDISSLRAVDKIQRDIEHILHDHDIYYDRRKNYYKNLGKPSGKIVSLYYVATAVLALVLGELSKASKFKAKIVRNQYDYNSIFNPQWKIQVFLKAVQIQRATDAHLFKYDFSQKKTPSNRSHVFRFLFAYLFVIKELGTQYYGPEAILKIDHEKMSKTYVDGIWAFYLKVEHEFVNQQKISAGYVRKPHKNHLFQQFILQRFISELGS